MKCPKCRRNMNEIRTPKGIYWRCPGCNTEIGKATMAINDVIEPTIVQEADNERQESDTIDETIKE